MLQFVVADSLTGRIVGQLEPSSFELTDPLRGAAGTGSLTIPIVDDDPDTIRRLVDLTLPRRRWVAVRDETGRFLWCGPIPRRPSPPAAGQLTVPLVDWRSWFYRAPIRPNANGTRRDYIRTGSAAREQTAIMTDLMSLALDTPGAPRITVDPPVTTGIQREITAKMLDRRIGEYLDDITSRERGPEWFTYCTQVDAQTLLVHAAAAWPERRTRTSNVRIEYRRGLGGNVASYAWPEGSDAPTRVWVRGEGEPPAEVWAVDESPAIADGAEVVWEDTIGPVDGVKKKATAFEYAYEAVQRSRGYEGTAEFTITDAQLPIGDVGTGDRTRVILDSGWDQAEVDAARVTSRTITGGRGEALQQRLSVDLADRVYGETTDDVPGEAVPDE